MSTVLEKTIEIIFQGDDRSAAAMNSVIGNMGRLEGSVRAVTGPLAAVADGAIKADLALNSLAFAGLAYAYAKSVEFEGAMIELEKVVGSDQVVALERAKAAALSLSETYGVSAIQIVESMANFKQAGFGLEESIKLVANTLDLVIAGNLEASQASEILIASLKGFGAPASEAARLIDILNEVSNNYATNVEQLGVGMAGISPIAKTMGLSMEETAGILTPVIEIFRSGDEAAIALKTGLLKLIDDSKPVKDALASIGVAQTDANGALRSGKDILYDVMKAFTGLTQEQKLFVTQQLVGIDQSARMVAVFDNLEYVLKVTETALDSAGSAAGEVAVRLASAQVQIEKFKQSFENLAVAIGDKFKLAATEAVSGATKINQAIRNMVDDGTFDDIFDLIDEFASELGKFFADVANALPEAMSKVDFSSLTDSFRRLAESAKELFEAVFPEDLTTAEGLAAAIQKIVNAWGTLNNITSGILDAWRPVFAAFGAFLEQLGDPNSNITKFATELGTMLGGVQIIDRLIERFGVLGSTIATMVIQGLDPATKAGGEFADTMGDTGYMIDDLEGSLGQQLVSAFGKYSSGAKTAEGDTKALGEAINNVPEEKEIGIVAGGAQEVKEMLTSIGMDIDKIPEEKIMELAAAKDTASFNEVFQTLGKIPDEKEVDVGAQADGTVDSTADYIDGKIPDEKTTDVNAQADQESITTASGQLEVLAGEKTTVIKAEADEVAIQRIKSQFEFMTAAVEWKAKLDIAEVEANADIIVGIAETLGKAFESSADIISSIFGAFSGDLGPYGDSWRKEMMQVVYKELALRERSMLATEALIAKQIDFMEAKIAAMKSGQAMIQIDGAGLQPHLEAFMWEVLAAIQTRVNQEGHAMLFGI